MIEPKSPDAIAWVFGQPLTDIPSDLFIPPDALQVMLHGFEGPLDLLLYLIRKQNIDVLDIPMRHITEQYLTYIQHLDEQHLDLAAEYLLMAAVLIEIKSRLLLPQPPSHDENEPTDPRAELVRRLLAYEQIKLAAQGLDALPRAGRDFAWAYLPVEIAVQTRLPEVHLSQLTQAWIDILSRAQHRQTHQVVEDSISIRACMSSILCLLQQQQGACTWRQLFCSPISAAQAVAYLIALLELIKEGQIGVEQEQPFDEITIFCFTPTQEKQINY